MSRPPLSNDSNPIWPSAEQRMKLPVVSGLHPSLQPEDELLKHCQLRTQARSGPGGQHRNRTASGAFLTYDTRHPEVGPITAEATEQRQQARNRSTALTRLRYLLAVTLRTSSPEYPFDSTESGKMDSTKECHVLESELRIRFRGTALKLNDQNADKPALLALVLNDLWTAGGQPSLIAECWKVSTTKLVNLVRDHPPAFQLVNRIRQHHSRPPLR
ncbi:peptide chain release factor-like protein [Rhodopirellula sp. JC740]|uniref:Peptide chain release factor-like protein n=1 Tax=Rhodopirellula halodulae TaxID=2894198 RepID=A0ABS8NP10_9BACT|nr:peptide chain release factor-like protein [Rhodopirellula sp. JC740]MCC9645334.1 peptide chain release factor-like protein [Rhodopirellula sp. JC740]